MIGTLLSCDLSGLRVSLGFFSDIIVPVEHLPQPSEWDVKEKLWVWHYEDEALFLDEGEEIRVKVVDVHFPVYKSTNSAKVQDKRWVGVVVRSEQASKQASKQASERAHELKDDGLGFGLGRLGFVIFALRPQRAPPASRHRRRRRCCFRRRSPSEPFCARR